MTLEKYTIGQLDQTDCAECGSPRMVGDIAYINDSTLEVFCSKACAESRERSKAPLVKPQPKGVRLDGWDI